MLESLTSLNCVKPPFILLNTFVNVEYIITNLQSLPTNRMTLSIAIKDLKTGLGANI